MARFSKCCPRCKGTGVIVSKHEFEVKRRVCGYCKGYGVVPKDEDLDFDPYEEISDKVSSIGRKIPLIGKLF